MDTGAILSTVSSFGTIIAAVALLLTYRQFRKLDESIKGNTYQLLSDQAIGILKLLLEYPHLRYLELNNPTISKADRQQAVFDRLVANYLDNVWGQMKLGLMNDELQVTYRSLIATIVTSNPEIARRMTQPNFTESLRQYIVTLATPSTADSAPARSSDA